MRLQTISLLTYALTISYSSCVLVTMKGAEYITYDIATTPIATEELRVIFNFKTIDPSGLLLFAENTQPGDFISLELIDGRLRYKAKLGFDDSSEQEIVIGESLNNYDWHVLDVWMRKRNVSVELDGVKMEKNFAGEFSRLDLDYKVFIGGVPDDVDVSPYKITNRKYSGCLKNYFFHDKDILYKAKYSKNGFSTHGDLLWNQCEDLNYQPIMMKNPQDHAFLPTYLKNSLSISFKFRTHVGEGLLFAKISQAVTVYVGLRKGELIFNVEIRGQGPVEIKKGNNLNDGFWHRVEFLVSKEIIKLKVDKHAETTHSNPWSHIIEFHSGNATLGGGEEQLMQGFVGCMYDIWVDDTAINYHKLGSDYFVGVVSKCSLQDRCLFSPCKHGGRCSQDHKSYRCDCLNTMYSGSNCEESIYQPSCQDYKNLGLNEDSYCHIDPDGDGGVKPFKVLCNMTSDSRKALTVFEHNLNQGKIAVNTGIIGGDSFHHYFKYGINIDTFDVLLQKATRCRQYVSFKCKNAFLLRSPRGPADTVWIGRRGSYENYWGGADPDSGTCACRKDKSCVHPYRYCNCDVGDDVWREDSGFFTQIDRLPVFQLNFKLSSNQSYFSIGNLQCEFNATIMPKNLSRQRILKACAPIHAQTTQSPRNTLPSLNQKERIINWNNNKKRFGSGTGSVDQKNNNNNKVNINVNLTIGLSGNKISLEVPKNNAENKSDGLKFTLSVYAVIAIAVAIVVVVIIIAIIIIFKRCQNRRRFNDTTMDTEDDFDDSLHERTEMCTFFGSVARSERNRPVIEVHRHSIHCDTLDELPPAYREYGDYQQPITTHIDLSYKSRRKNLGFFC